jgi:hypothetical protein
MWFYPILELEKKYRIIAPLFTPQTMGAQEATGFVRSILKTEVIYEDDFCDTLGQTSKSIKINFFTTLDPNMGLSAFGFVCG